MTSASDPSTHVCPRCGPSGRVFVSGRGAAACARCGGSFVLFHDAFATFRRVGIDARRLEIILRREGQKLHRCVTCQAQMVTFPIDLELFHACVPCGALWADAGALDRIARPSTDGPFAGLPLAAPPEPATPFAAFDPFRDAASFDMSAAPPSPPPPDVPFATPGVEQAIDEAIDEVVDASAFLVEDTDDERTQVTRTSDYGHRELAQGPDATRSGDVGSDVRTLEPMWATSFTSVPPTPAVVSPPVDVLAPPLPYFPPTVVAPAARATRAAPTASFLPPVVLTPPSEGPLRRTPDALPRTTTPVTGAFARPADLDRITALVPEALPATGLRSFAGRRAAATGAGATGTLRRRRRSRLLAAAAVPVALAALAALLVAGPSDTPIGGGRSARFPGDVVMVPLAVDVGEKAATRTATRDVDPDVPGDVLEATYIPGAGATLDGDAALAVLRALYDGVVPIGVPSRDGDVVVVHAVVRRRLDGERALVGRVRAAFTLTDAWVMAALAEDDGSFARSRDAERFLRSLR